MARLTTSHEQCATEIGSKLICVRLKIYAKLVVSYVRNAHKYNTSHNVI